VVVVVTADVDGDATVCCSVTAVLCWAFTLAGAEAWIVVEEGGGGATVWSADGLGEVFWLAGDWVDGGGVPGAGVLEAGAGVDAVVSSCAFFSAEPVGADAPEAGVGTAEPVTRLTVLGGADGKLATGGGAVTTGIGGGGGAVSVTTGAWANAVASADAALTLGPPLPPSFALTGGVSV
jgi:hypothetical protein